MEGIAWEWHAIDASMNNASMAKESSRRNPTDRGTKRHILVDERGVSLSFVVTGANRHDVSQLKQSWTTKLHCRSWSLSLKIYARMLGMREKLENPYFKARRWGVEACHSWFNRFRKLTIRYEKFETTHLALIHLAAAIIALRKIKTQIIYG